MSESSKQFVISAHVVRQLGEQLVSDEVTALIELVKNAYDADARSVVIEVNTKGAYQDETLSPTATGPVAPTGYVLLSDTGTGMDETDVTKGWLHISFSAKRGVNELGIVTPRFGRSLLGSKGVGRLSAQRIGNRLDLFSLKEYYEAETNNWRKAEKGVHVGINWNDFGEGVGLQEVPVAFEYWQPKNGRPGTKLVVTDLQNPEVWEEEASRSALVSTLVQMISPFEPAKSFSINLKINNLNYDLFELTKGIRDTAISTYDFRFDNQELVVRGKVKTTLFRATNKGDDLRDFQALIATDNGAGFLAYLIDNKVITGIQPGVDGWLFTFETRIQAVSLGLVIVVDGSDNAVIASPGPFHGEIDQLAYDGYDAEVGSPDAVFNQVADYRDYVRKQAGLRIYRDGFGIRPYGIDGDDWIGFQAGTTSGSSFYGLRPKNLIGYVSLTAKANGSLEEKTDREGFVLSPASRNFFLLMGQVKEQINGMLSRVRRRYNSYKELLVVEQIKTVSPREVLGNLRDTAQQVSELNRRVERNNIAAVQTSIEKKLTAIKHTPLLESGNDAALGPLLTTVQAELDKAKEIVEILAGMHARLQELAPVAMYIEGQLQQLNSKLTDYSELAGVGLTAETLSHEIGNVVDRLLEETKQVTDFMRKQQGVSPEVLLFTERVRSSLHALRRQTQHLAPSLRYLREKRETIDIERFADGVRNFYESRTRFQESGIKILVEKQDKVVFKVTCSRGKLTQIFDNLIINSEYWLREALRQKRVTDPLVTITLRLPFIEIADNGIGVDPGIVPNLFEPFVTTKPKEVGRGLGLFITAQLLDSMGCTIELLPSLNRFQRPFLFRIDLTGALHEQSAT